MSGLKKKLNEFGCFDEISMPAVDQNLPNIVAKRNGSREGKGLFFNGHTDVVPVSEKQEKEWRKMKPWSGEIAENKIWGRGASDMKGGNTAFIWAIKILHDLGIKLKGDCIATLVVGEETADKKIGIDAVMQSTKLPKTGIIAEATDLQICPATMGEFYFSIKIFGKSCNLALRHKTIYPSVYGEDIPGVNAIDLMRKIQNRLVELEHQWGLYRKHPLMEPGNMSISITKIQGGDTYSAIAENCEMIGGVIYAPDLKYEEVKNEFLEAIDQVVKSDYWLRENPPEITIPYFIPNKPANNLSVNHPLTKVFERARRNVMGGEPAFSTPTSNTNDGNYMVEKGYETITFGLRENNNHGTNEFIYCEDLLNMIKVYALGILEWCEWDN
ncbi:M20/M25/M40 family metallo-hydrolase [Virgibacillus halophilus]|uniref:M20/M25/M40 family metallo-hydrolase n=1 Tax=Tigheibacillus halophilus TaxID=361280 RepID=A0ABU5C2Y0_9BACI|nr:M20/M25/M40 family metallo-hydrolase [Virgibacillus halophilus]